MAIAGGYLVGHQHDVRPFVVNLFADASNAKCELFYSAEDNALTQDWSARLVILRGAAYGNPPYSRASQHEDQYITGIRQIMAPTLAMCELGGRYVCLIKAATGEATKNPRARVLRQRLSLDEWRAIYAEAEKMQPWVSRSMLLALITGQRVGDIAAMKFTDVWDDLLHIVQEKTGSRVAIPLSLRSEALGMSLREAIALCHDSVLSPWLLHQRPSQGNGRPGEALKKRSLTITFSRARDKTGLSWESGTPPSFHEQRSLSERLYREQGIDTQTLLGHKSQSMTDKYNDDRGKEWKVVFA